MTTTEQHAKIDLRQRLAHIDQMLADIDRTYADRRRIDADHDRKRQEIHYAPWLAVSAGMTAGAALFGAGAAVGAILVRLYGG